MKPHNSPSIFGTCLPPISVPYHVCSICPYRIYVPIVPMSTLPGRPRGLKGSMPRRGAPKFVRDKAWGGAVGWSWGDDHGTGGYG